jgi:hypothetical protein
VILASAWTRSPAFAHAQTDSDAARQLLALLTMGSHRREVHEQEIAFVQDNGVPADFLLDTAELDQLFPRAGGATLG